MAIGTVTFMTDENKTVMEKKTKSDLSNKLSTQHLKTKKKKCRDQLLCVLNERKEMQTHKVRHLLFIIIINKQKENTRERERTHRKKEEEKIQLLNSVYTVYLQNQHNGEEEIDNGGGIDLTYNRCDSSWHNEEKSVSDPNIFANFIITR
jgi:hypothetical protein